MIGAAIKEYLDKNGIKQSFISERTGIKPSRMSKICNSKQKIDCVEYYKICTALNVPLEQFLTGIEV